MYDYARGGLLSIIAVSSDRSIGLFGLKAAPLHQCMLWGTHTAATEQ
jgi:hypothetical protein